MFNNVTRSLVMSLTVLLPAVQHAAAQSENGNALPSASIDLVTFKLVPNPQFISCLAGSSYSYKKPWAQVTVKRGSLNDFLVLEAHNLRPNLKFDLFTAQNSPFLYDGSKDSKFKNFGLAWYQSDIEANKYGDAYVTIQTILLDQIFGFDPAVNLAPTNTFHVGFWFNDPNDAVPCGFPAGTFTPFNGEHHAGPLAMISLPAKTGLGPLCTNPDTSKSPAVCHP